MNHNRAHAVPLRLIDGSIINTQRNDLVQRMAEDLIAAGTFGDERDAIMTLVGKYPPVQICHLIDDVRQAAQQEIVAWEMAKP